MISEGWPISAWAMPKRWRMPPEKVPSLRLRTFHRLTCCSSACTRALRSPRTVTPLSTAKWSSMASAETFGYTPNSCGR